MASLIPYTKELLVQRIRQHIVNDFPSSELNVSVNEVLLYIDQALAYNMVGQVYNMAKVEGNLVMPEAYLTTYSLTLSQDSISGYWYGTLPQPPVSLPLGYSINRVYAGKAGLGQSDDFLPIKAKRVGYRKYMPLPNGARYWVEGSKIWCAMSDGSDLGSYTIYVSMAKTRTESLSELLNLPDDAIEAIFQNVVNKLKDRLQLPQDIVADDITPGNKSS